MTREGNAHHQTSTAWHSLMETGAMSSNQKIEVAFQGPFSLEPQHGLPHVIGGLIGRDKAGVYLWAIELAGAYLINYVGETRAGFGARTRDQVKWIRDNRDTIVDVDRFLKGERCVLYTTRNLPSYEVFCRRFPSRHRKTAPSVQSFLGATRLLPYQVCGGRDFARAWSQRVQSLLGKQDVPKRAEGFD
jgi:hypothetical protein